MSQTAEDLRWKIPYGITFDKLSKIIQLILRKNGDEMTLTIDSILPAADLAKNFLSSNLNFLKAVNIIEGDYSGFKLTPLGADFAKSLSLDNKDDIKKYSLDIFAQSYLNDLKITIENEGDSLTKDKLLKIIKTNAKISGNSIAEMPKTSKAGANALLSWLNEIELISGDIIKTKISNEIAGKKHTVTKQQGKIPPSGFKPDSSRINKNDNFVLNTDKISLFIDRNIESDDLELAKKQVDMLFEHAKKKTASKPNPTVL